MQLFEKSLALKVLETSCPGGKFGTGWLDWSMIELLPKTGDPVAAAEGIMRFYVHQSKVNMLVFKHLPRRLNIAFYSP